MKNYIKWFLLLINFLIIVLCVFEDTLKEMLWLFIIIVAACGSSNVAIVISFFVGKTNNQKKNRQNNDIETEKSNEKGEP